MSGLSHPAVGKSFRTDKGCPSIFWSKGTTALCEKIEWHPLARAYRVSLVTRTGEHRVLWANNLRSLQHNRLSLNSGDPTQRVVFTEFSP